MITRDDWLNALSDCTAPPSDDSALTTDELAAVLGVSLATARRRISKLLAAGKLTACHKRITRANGNPLLVRAFRLAP